MKGTFIEKWKSQVKKGTLSFIILNVLKEAEYYGYELIEEIKMLISSDGSTIEINPNYLEYFTLEELEEMKSDLIFKKENIVASTKEYVDELYEKLSI